MKQAYSPQRRKVHKDLKVKKTEIEGIYRTLYSFKLGLRRVFCH